MRPLLELHGVAKTYETDQLEVQALREVSLTIREGEFVAIMGPSGSGKSTLLALMGGLEKPSLGQVLLGGRPLSHRPETELAALRREQIGFVFQAFNLVPVLTAAENVALPLLLAGQKGAAVTARAEEMLRRVGLADRGAHMPAQLSGGEQQRVAIARALITRPPLLLADEPTGNLDSRTSRTIMDLLRRTWTELGQTIVVITHDAGIAAWADRVLILRDGLIVSDWRPEAPVESRAHAIRTRLEELADADDWLAGQGGPTPCAGR